MGTTEQIRFILINTTHPGNIGATARAMKNMGFHDLALVAPLHFPSVEATTRSSGAEDVLQAAKVANTLRDVTQDCNILFGTSSRKRALAIPLLSVKEAAELIKPTINAGNKIAILFGQERMGLTNEELAMCHYHLYIPCNPDFPSLNLAAAVQVIAYELLCSLQMAQCEVQITSSISHKERELFYEHLEATLIKLNFIDPTNPRLLMRKLRRLFNRSSIEQNEMNILRGILTAIDRKIAP